MEEAIESISSHLISVLETLPPTERYLVGISGIPGSGKTTLTALLCNRVNERWAAVVGQKARDEGDDRVRVDSHSSISSASSSRAKEEDARQVCTTLPFDGFHLPRSTLSTFPDVQLAFDKRGAPHTFDPESLYNFLKAIKESPTQLHAAPSFDHAKKDPLEGDIPILPLPIHRIVLIEGLYVNAAPHPTKQSATEPNSEDPNILHRLPSSQYWTLLSSLLSLSLVLSCPPSLARSRLISRHVRTGVASDEVEAQWRIENNDEPNGTWLLNNLKPPPVGWVRIRGWGIGEESLSGRGLREGDWILGQQVGGGGGGGGGGDAGGV